MRYAETHRPRFSPDGRWVAYTSNEKGAVEVFVRSFPDGDEKQQVSRGDGIRPVWRRDSGEVFFLSPDGDLMAATIAAHPTLAVGPPAKLLLTPIDPGVLGFYQYDVHPDGKRFVIVAPVSDTPQPVNVILNW